MEYETKSKYLPFGYKLMVSYSVIILIPVLLAGYVANSIFVNSIQERAHEIHNGTIQQMKDNISYKIDDLTRISNMIYLDTTLSSSLRSYEEGWQSYETTTKYLLPKFQTTLEAANNKIWLSVYLHNNTLPEIYHNYDNTNPLNSRSSVFDLYHIDRIADKSWYKEFPPEKYKVTMQWKQIEDDANFARISLLRRVIDTGNPLQLKELGFVRISVRLKDLLETVDHEKLGKDTTIVIMDQSRRIISSSSKGETINGQILREKTKEDLVIQEELSGLNWDIVAFVPKDMTDQTTSEVRMWTILICLGCFIIFASIGMFMSRYFGKKVHKIISVLDSFHEGDFHKRIKFKGRDEFTIISLALNEMGQNIGNLIKEVYITNIQKKEAELESLQAQINPHFLYNTLSSISRLAKFGEMDKLQRMVMDLAKFYRLSLNEGRTVIPVKHELEQVEAYINIQKTKFGDDMAVYYDINPEILQYTTIKLILQPFVENVLKHARYEDRINIRIVGRLEENQIAFHIIDDGIGIAPDIICQIFDPVDGLNVGYGIRNVDQRIRLYFGNLYGVSIVSKLGIGTTVRIIIPVELSREVQQSNYADFI
jgi:two-component system sensor histidine kinase YesM